MVAWTSMITVPMLVDRRIEKQNIYIFTILFHKYIDNRRIYIGFLQIGFLQAIFQFFSIFQKNAINKTRDFPFFIVLVATIYIYNRRYIFSIIYYIITLSYMVSSSFLFLPSPSIFNQSKCNYISR